MQVCLYICACIRACFISALFSSVTPEITYEDKYKEPQTLKAGSTLIIHVTISGYPKPKVTWTFNEEAISIKDGTTIETTDTYSTLTIKGVGGANSGSYKVTAENVVASVSADFTVTVRGMQQKCICA